MQFSKYLKHTSGVWKKRYICKKGRYNEPGKATIHKNKDDNGRHKSHFTVLIHSFPVSARRQ
jgi:hypothetical protein